MNVIKSTQTYTHTQFGNKFFFLNKITNLNVTANFTSGERGCGIALVDTLLISSSICRKTNWNVSKERRKYWMKRFSSCFRCRFTSISIAPSSSRAKKSGRNIRRWSNFCITTKFIWRRRRDLFHRYANVNNNKLSSELEKSSESSNILPQFPIFYVLWYFWSGFVVYENSNDVY